MASSMALQSSRRSHELSRLSIAPAVRAPARNAAAPGGAAGTISRMRAAPALVVGLIAGGALGFVLHAWLGGEAERDERPQRARESEAAATPPALPTPNASRAERLTAPPAPVDAEVAAPTGAASSPAADALVGILVHGAVLDPDNRPAQLGEWNNLKFDSGAGEP